MTKKHMNWGWFFVTPYIVGFIIFTLFALVFVGYISFTEYNIINPPKWVGLENHIEAWTSKELWLSFRNVAVYTIILESLLLFIGSIFASLLNQKVRGIGVFRLLYFIPVLTPMVAVSFVWMSMYNPTYGILNHLLSFFGIGPFRYILSSNWFEAVASVAVMNVWKGVGYTTIYLLAGIQGISGDVLEAAEIDGAGVFSKFFKIKLPLLTPTIFFLMVTGVIGALQVFDAFYIMVDGSAANESVDVIGTLIYKNAFVYSKVGYASAIGWVSFVAIAIITFVQKVLEKRWVNYG